MAISIIYLHYGTIFCQGNTNCQGSTPASQQNNNGGQLQLMNCPPEQNVVHTLATHASIVPVLKPWVMSQICCLLLVIHMTCTKKAWMCTYVPFRWTGAFWLKFKTGHLYLGMWTNIGESNLSRKSELNNDTCNVNVALDLKSSILEMQIIYTATLKSIVIKVNIW